MVTLTRDECRVLGVLIEKAQTTPGQYPLTLNALVLGCNQKNNRDPLTNFTEERVYDAIDKLRKAGVVREVMLSGSRVAKFRHVAREALAVTTEELVILAELLLRGPQSVGELRGRATRMHPIETLEAAQALLDGMMSRPEPLVRELPAPPGQRAKNYAQLLCPDLHPLNHVSRGSYEEEDDDGNSGGERAPMHDPALAARVDQLEDQVRVLRLAVQKLASSLGEPDPLT
jgi:uncharacterized protein YceH (UPF0502 family)